MRSIQDRLDEFNARRVEVLAISVDSPANSLQFRLEQGFTFPLLSDEKRELIRLYDLVHERGRPDGEDIARPAEFLIDVTGTVRWVSITKSYAVRVRPEQVLSAFDELGLGQAVPDRR